MKINRSPWLKRGFFLVAFMLFLTPNVWNIPTAQAFAGGNGSSGNPYQISNCTELHAIGGSPSSSFVLNGNIDCSNFGNFSPISSFRGTFNGNNYMISGVTITNTNNNGDIGLFASTVSPALIENVIIKNLTLNNDQNSAAFIGGLVGLLEDSTVQHVSLVDLTVNGNHNGGTGSYLGGAIGIAANGNISQLEIIGNSSVVGGTYVGGLIGILDNSFADSNAQLINCSSAASVSSTGGYVGGLVGVIETPIGNGPTGSIQKSFATGNVSGPVYVGAFIGVTGGPFDIPIQYNFATGSTPGSNFFGSGGGFGNNYITDYYTGSNCSGCNANIDGTTWYNNTTTAPLNQWDFSSVWIKQGGTFPKLRFDPILTESSAIPTATTNTTPSYTFTSTKAGTITYGGSCGSATSNASSGNNTITLNSLADGTYSNCTIKVTDSSSYASNILGISTFTIDTVSPGVFLSSSSVSGGNTNQPAISVTATFTENVTGFASDDVNVTNGSISNFNALSGSQYSFNLNPTNYGPVSLTINAGRAQDAAGNNNTAASYIFNFIPVSAGGSDISTTNSNASPASQPENAVNPALAVNPPVSNSSPVPANNGNLANNTEGNLPDANVINDAVMPKEPFIDIIGHWAHDYILELYHWKVVNGRNRLHFVPEGKVTLAEAIKIGLLTYGYPLDANDFKIYAAYNDKNSWCLPYLKKAAKEGFIANKIGNPDGNINRQDALILLLKMAKKSGKANPAPFLDLDQKSPAASFINYAFAQGIIQGRSSTKFDPTGTITRAEIAKLAIKIKML